MIVSYTVRVDADDASGAVWKPAYPAKTITADDSESPADVAADIAAGLDPAAGRWRVRLWDGPNAPTAAAPVVSLVVWDEHQGAAS